MPQTRLYSRWNSQPTVASLQAPEFKWDVLVNQAFPAVNAATGRSLTPRGSRFEGSGGRGQNWLGVNSLEQISVPLPTTSTGYSMLWVGPINQASYGGASVIRTTGGGFRFEPYSTPGGGWVSATHTGVASILNTGWSWTEFGSQPWVVLISYDGTVATTNVRVPTGELYSTTATVGMNAGTGTLDLSTSTGSFGAYLVGYASRPMPERLRARYLQAPWNVFVQNKYLGWSSATDSVNLTGIATTISSGTLTLATSVPLVGLSTTSALGTLKAALAVTLTGQSVSVSNGTLVPAVGNVVSLTGLAATISSGTLVPATAVPLTGQSVTVSNGTLIPVIGNAVNLFGQSVTVNRGSVVAALAVGLLGQAVTISQGTITPSAGGNVSVNLTGNSATVSGGTLTPSLGEPPETITFSWANKQVVFTLSANNVLFRFD